MKKILSTIIALTLLLGTSILSAADFNYDTGLALKAKNASEATMTAMEKRYDKILSVGVHGIILSSEDSGSTWRQVDRVPFSNTLTDIYCVSDTQCWAIGHDASIFHTIDSGETWSLQYEDEFFDEDGGAGPTEAELEAMMEIEMAAVDDPRAAENKVTQEAPGDSEQDTEPQRASVIETPTETEALPAAAVEEEEEEG